MAAVRTREPRRRTFPIGGGQMAALDLGPKERPVDLVFLHANGFNALTYRRILQPLADRLRILAPDLRGHGRTELPADPVGRRSWRDLRDDVAALVAALDGPPVVLAGHSMGGTTALLAAAKLPAQVSGVALFDPVMWSPFGVAMAHLPWAAMAARRAPLVAQTTRRRSEFDSREAALQAYLGRGAFRSWPREMVADYVADGLRDRPDGKVELSCDPRWEASNYVAHAHDPYAALRAFGGPARILKATQGSTCRISDTEAFARRYPNASVETIEGGHFFPMEKPDAARVALAAAAAG